MAIRFATGNEGKLEEAREYLREPIERVEYDYVEIQSDELAEIAAHGAREAYEAVGGDGVLVDDSGLFVEALGGFPGPYSAYVEDTVGVERLWQLASREENRRARFRGVVAYCGPETLAGTADPSPDPTRVETTVDGVVAFSGSVAGTLVAPRGEGGFGYDPIFEYNGRTLAEMDAAEKNAISHRGRALERFADWRAGR